MKLLLVITSIWPFSEEKTHVYYNVTFKCARDFCVEGWLVEEDCMKHLQHAAGSVCEHCSRNGHCKVINCVSGKTNVADEGTEWIFSKEHRGFFGIAHNASGYDGQFILKSFISRNKARPAVIMAGTKVISLKYKGVKLIDSLKYLTMSLAAVGKAFRIPTENGDFPVKFIKREKFDYVGDIPEDKFYNLEHKSITVRQKLTDCLKEERATRTFSSWQVLSSHL
ncbi:hypothetical protein CRE_08476 [Caenorhabditis remanei]|uniref:DNA-directed DNA polymerase n=1 Tax=Caenorhabditis remanei TaxID=31234 RepID=E3N036_CAERE|nr:hypothetical protein CRE_08476 [Caenorhabditis remanei]